MKIKEGVRIHGLKPEMNLGSQIVESIYLKHGKEPVITSGIEGSHSEYSDHYKGYALDFRTRYFTADQAQKVATDVSEALGDDFFVLLHKTHLHVSYRPRRLI